MHSKVTKFLSSVNLLPVSTSLNAIFSFTIDRSLFTSSFLQLYIFRHFENRWDSRLATRYRLGGPGIESRWGREFSQPSGPTHPTSPTMCSWSFQGVRRPRRVFNNPLLSNVLVKEIVQPYFYSPSVSLWRGNMVKFAFTSRIRGFLPLQWAPLPFSISKFPAWAVLYHFCLS